MLNKSGISKTTYGAPKQILANVELQASIGVIVPQSLVPNADANGKKPMLMLLTDSMWTK